MWYIAVKEIRVLCSCFLGKEDKRPIANPGADIVTRAGENITLNGIESWDDKNITNYEWTLLSGDHSVVIKVNFSTTLLRR